MAADGLDECRARAMGTDVHVLVVGGPAGAASAALERIDAMERRWSRFLNGSEVTALNRAGGRPTVVSTDTAALVAVAVEAWRATAGVFDPTVLDALEGWGYDRSFEHIGAATPVSSRAPAAAPGCDGILVAPSSGLVMLPRGVTIDLGGIGKGRAADIVVGEVLAAGAEGVCVNIGGDLRAAGSAPGGGRWWIGVEDELVAGQSLGAIEIDSGAVATSTPRRRRWQCGDRSVHHLIDPRSGVPAESGLASVTVLARDAAWAEVLAKAAYVSGLDAGLELLARLGGEGMFLTDGGDVVLSPGFAAVCA